MAENIDHGGERVVEFAGGPAGARNALGRAFLRAMAADFAHGGRKAIETMREDRPHDYVRLVAALLPKEFPSSNPGIEDMTDDEFDRALNEIRSIIAARTAEGGSGEAQTRDPAADRG
jgi:hypothetical protein